jgi:putative ABC transport system permease protein
MLVTSIFRVGGDYVAIIIKFILKNIWEKKLRTFLILFSIIISSALFFASNAISGTFENMYVERMKKYYGSAEIMMYPGEKATSSFFYLNRTDVLSDYLDYIVGTVQSNAIYKISDDEILKFSLMGINYNDLQVLNPIVLNKELDLVPFIGNKLIIGKDTAEKYKLKIGSSIKLEIRNATHKFLICGISEPMGLFLESGDSGYAIMPRETLSSIYNNRGMVSTAYLKVKDASEKQFVIDKMSDIYKQHIVRETITQEDIKRSSGGITSAFMAMVVTLLIMSMFIIYTSFKVITMERLPVIGTFRSIGATKKITGAILIAESIIYGVIGGVIGVFLGIGVLYIITYYSTPTYLRAIKISIIYNNAQLLAAFIMAVSLSFISSLIPIIKISKIPVKDIVLNKTDKDSKKRKWKPLLGLILVISAVPGPFINIKGLGILIDGISVVSMIAGIIILIPFVTGLFIKIFERFYNFIFGNEGIIAVKNLRNNKSMFNNISLLAIGISTMLMINTVSYSVGKEVLNAYGIWKFDIYMNIDNADRNTERLIQSIDGVDSVYNNYEVYGVKLWGNNDSDNICVQGVNTRKFFNFFNIDFEGDQESLVKRLDEGRYILATNIFRNKYNLKKGDIVNLNISNKMRSYEVAGFFDTLMENGSYLLVSEKYLEADGGQQNSGTIKIKTNKDPEIVVNEIKSKFKGRDMWINTVKAMEERNKKDNDQLMNTLKGFSVMTLVIGIFGVLNNFLISFLERKRSLAMFKSMGMSKKQIIKMLFVESLTGGIVGGIVGMFSGFALVLYVEESHLLNEAIVPITMHYQLETFLSSMVLGIMITIIASIGPALKSSRLNIIEAIKFE